MNTALKTTTKTTRRDGRGRRGLMKFAAGTAALGVLATAACAPTERTTAIAGTDSTNGESGTRRYVQGR